MKKNLLLIAVWAFSLTLFAQNYPDSTLCQASFTFQTDSANSSVVHFVNQSIGNANLFIWDFGDGCFATTNTASPNVSHQYSAPGNYIVNLGILGNGCSSSFYAMVSVNTSASQCQAQFVHLPDSITENLIHFYDISLGNPTQWSWDFGDLTDLATVQNPDHQYNAPGTYTVCLTISGANCQSTACMSITVGSVVNCENHFTYSQIGNVVSFAGEMVNGGSATYSWDFGDSQSGTGQNALHTYVNNGIYNVVLTTLSGDSCTSSSTNVIWIGDTLIMVPLYGQVFAGSSPINAGVVLLLSLNASNVPYVETSLLDSIGGYYFPMVPHGDFVIYAIPFDSTYLPTYFGNVQNWQDATLIHLGNPANPYNIQLLQSNGFLSGDGSIEGQVNEGDYANSIIGSITMLLKDSNGNTIMFNQVSDAGAFNFPQLAYGVYYLYAELAGYTTQEIMVEISEANPNANIVLHISGNLITGLKDNQAELEAGKIYPNPAKDNGAKITIKNNGSSKVNIEVYSTSGQIMYQNSEAVYGDETTIMIPTNRLNEGVYILKIFTVEGLALTRKLVKSK